MRFEMSCEKSLYMWQPSKIYPFLHDKRLCGCGSDREKDFLSRIKAYTGSYPDPISDIENKLPRAGYVNPKTGEFAPVYSVGCGFCYACRMQYALNWATRLMMEKRSFPDDCYFLTLTYDDEFLPHSKVHPGLSSLCKADFQDFHKRLRYYLYGDSPPPEEKPYRYFLAGEYGDSTFRAHGHEISFNLPLPDLKFYTRHDGIDVYTSDFLKKVWKNGEVWIEDVTPASCAYVARYIEKKQKRNDAWLYDEAGIEPEFTIMSTRPGIGSFSKDFIRNADGSLKQKIALPGGTTANVPKFFDKFLSEKELAEVKSLRDWRSEQFLKSVLGETDKDFYTYMRDCAKSKIRKKKIL